MKVDLDLPPPLPDFVYHAQLRLDGHLHQRDVARPDAELRTSAPVQAQPVTEPSSS